MTQPRPKPSIPWWGRLEVRVVAALVVLGTLCVGASAYLVQLTVSYFDVRLEQSLAQSDEAVESVAPVHLELVDAHRTAFEARARAMGIELALPPTDPQATDDARLRAMLARELDVVGLSLQRRTGPRAHVDREGEFPPDQFEWFPVVAAVGPPQTQRTGNLEVVFRIDPSLDARYQELGELARDIGQQQRSRADIERAVVRVVGIASIGVLLISVLAGIVVARATTRKVSALTKVMEKVAAGDLHVRTRRLGRDELGQLGEAFNDMLDQLDHAQQRVAYLQRIGAWQGMARRIAHEIKNPLTPIQLAVQQLREKDPGLSPQFSRLLQTSTEIVEDEVEALRTMVTSFSQFAKVPEVRLERIDAGRVLEEFERAYGHLSEQEEDVLEVQPPLSEVPIAGDRQLLKQALVNLVENAVLSARDAGTAPVHVRVAAVADGDQLRITVDDNGPGIPSADRQRVFEPYETGREHGTGLGLAIVKKIVLDHGGEIEIDDSPLGGARFVVRLPRPDSDAR